MHFFTKAISGLGLALAMSSSQAASVFLDPAAQLGTTGDNASVDLKIDFTDLFPTPGSVGGGVNIAVSGAASFLSFAPSAYFNGLDPFFTGSGTANADPGTDFEVHFGNFPSLPGLDQIQTIGTFTVSLDSAGLGAMDLSINTFWGFPDDPTLTGATVEVTDPSVVPVPAAVWLFGSGLVGLIGIARRKRPQA